MRKVRRNNGVLLQQARAPRVQSKVPNFGRKGMKRKKSLAAAAVLQAVVFGGVGLSLMGSNSVVARAQAATLAVGVVDEDKLAEGYKEYRAAVERIDAKAKDLDSQLAARELLSTQDGAAFDVLVSKTRTGGDITRFNELVTKGTNNLIEYKRLIPLAVKTEVDKKRILALQELAKNNASTLRTKSDELYNAVKKEQEETDKRYTDQANNVIAQVAGQKGFVVVIRQRAVVWSDPKADITDAVLTNLNK